MKGKKLKIYVYDEWKFDLNRSFEFNMFGDLWKEITI